MFSFNASAGVGREEYPGDTNFGLRNNDNHVYSVGFDFVPAEAVELRRYATATRNTRRCRRRGPRTRCRPTRAILNDPTQQFNDPRRDWTDDSADRVHTFNASIDLHEGDSEDRRQGRLRLQPRGIDLRLRSGAEHGHRGAGAAPAGAERTAARHRRRAGTSSRGISRSASSTGTTSTRWTTSRWAAVPAWRSRRPRRRRS